MEKDAIMNVNGEGKRIFQEYTFHVNVTPQPPSIAANMLIYLHWKCSYTPPYILSSGYGPSPSRYSSCKSFSREPLERRHSSRAGNSEVKLFPLSMVPVKFSYRSPFVRHQPLSSLYFLIVWQQRLNHGRLFLSIFLLSERNDVYPFFFSSIFLFRPNSRRT